MTTKIQTKSKTGSYTKYSNFNNPTIITFVAKNDNDNFHKVLEMIREQNKDYNCFQTCEHEEEKENFNTIFYVNYNIWGEPLKGIYIHFDFDNNKVITEKGKSYKVKECNEYVYKIQKTQIKAIDGIAGLYKHIIESMHINSPMDSYTFSVLEKLNNQ